MKTQHFYRNELIVDISTEARIIDIPVGAARAIAENVADAVENRLAKKTTITQRDYSRIVAEELEKYSPDLAYIYHNRDKII